MSQTLYDLLERFRAGSQTEREKGTYFEQLAIDFLKNDPEFADQFDGVWTFSDWAQLHDEHKKDLGIDLVAKNKDEDGFCAIQCKFYKEDHRIQKSDIDSFFTESGKKPFTRRLIIDTTSAPWSENAERALVNQHTPVNRIGLSYLANSPIDWSVYFKEQKIVLAAKKQLRLHQEEALAAVQDGLSKADRGKLIMACGTGKTFTGLKIAETLAGKGKHVLFLVPSLSLMSQTVREWTIDAGVPLRSFAVCSDVKVGKRKRNADLVDVQIHDLAFPATTDAAKLAEKANTEATDEMTVVFSTYQSIQVISEAQKEHGFPEFDLIICDEAHRTTGAKLGEDDESNFTKIHRQEFIKGKKRLYMTATPRIFGESAKAKADEHSIELCSMDNPDLYGEVLFERGFSWAVQNDLLTDYKVIVLAVDEGLVSRGVQKRLSDENSELLLDDATKIIGCYKALTKADMKEDVAADPAPMQRALAFCRDIRSSKLVANEFSAVVDEYRQSGNVLDGFPSETYKLECEVDHVDGTFNAEARTRLLDWLKEETDEDTCRILSNARCLSEGVDVPALDAILFLHPRKSQIDIVQSVGRVMRKAPGKKMGYVILPVGVPAGMAPEEALNDNERYKVVWQILNALRAHDDRFDATINKMGLGVDVSGKIEIIAEITDLPQKSATLETNLDIGKGGTSEQERETNPSIDSPQQRSFIFDEFSSAIIAKIVKKCGRRTYWEDWATDIAKIAEAHIERINAVLDNQGSKEKEAFDAFLAELKDDLNDSITQQEAVEMLAQHLITKPVFEALFEDYSFTKNNPVSVAMQSVLDALQEQNIDKEAEKLQKFYDSVRFRASGIDNAQAKQKLIVELYDKFFKNAFPKLTERLGIVYTPVEIVDFIINSVDEVLQEEFGQTLGSRGVHILDPFTGTGTFITRLLQSGLIKPGELEHKYKNEIHANEIVLLAYYIAAVNIEAAYHTLSGGDYIPFEGICLTDTFQLYEQDHDMIADLMPDNSERRTRQKELDIRVIFGNPPYSAQQASENEDNKNTKYPSLDDKIRNTFVKLSSSKLAKNAYDNYLRAIKWSSERIGNTGLIGFVTNGSFIDAKNLDGVRRSLYNEFDKIFVFDLRGDQRTSGEASKREGGKVFGSGSRAPVAITFLLRTGSGNGECSLSYYDIGDYLSREDKFEILAEKRSLSSLEWSQIIPNEESDWINQRDPQFQEFMALARRDSSKDDAIFSKNSYGVITSRDPWVYNFSREKLETNVKRLISAYNHETTKYREACSKANNDQRPKLEDVVRNDPKVINWSRSLKKSATQGKTIEFKADAIITGAHRPFSKQYMYFSRELNEMINLTHKMFPSPSHKNIVISCTGVTERKGFSCIATNLVPNMHLTDTGMCFPLYQYDDAESSKSDLFGQPSSASGSQKSAISSSALAQFRKHYSDDSINEEDIFWYVYGVLHSAEYRKRFTVDLQKLLPRIPFAADFWIFSNAGRKLGELHINYESQELYPISIKEGDLRTSVIDDPDSFFRVSNMRFKGKRGSEDKSTLIFNKNITITNIPQEAYQYVIAGKSAIEWVMERQAVKIDGPSGITNDANDYALFVEKNPKYILELLQRIITVSVETVKIVNNLPPLKF